MTRLTVYTDNGDTKPVLDTRDHARITAELKAIGVAFDHWQANAQLPDGADQAAVLAIYRDQLEKLERTYGYQSKDVVRLNPDHPDRQALRAKFLAEHTHDDDEVRIFVEGGATFFLHAPGKVYELYAERGDLINVPAGAKHWFDTGIAPSFTAIRLFTSPSGWEARFTGDAVASRFTAPTPAQDGVPA